MNKSHPATHGRSALRWTKYRSRQCGRPVLFRDITETPMDCSISPIFSFGSSLGGSGDTRTVSRNRIIDLYAAPYRRLANLSHVIQGNHTRYMIRVIFIFELADPSMVRIQTYALFVVVTQGSRTLIHDRGRRGSELCLDGLVKCSKQQTIRIVSEVIVDDLAAFRSSQDQKRRASSCESLKFSKYCLGARPYLIPCVA